MNPRPLRAAVAARVAAAVVRLPRKGGQGVVVPGGFVVTAAHCIEWTAEGGMAAALPDDYFVEEIVAADGRSLRVQPLAVEPVSDLAVLGALDEEHFPEQADAFEDFCGTTEPVRLVTNEVDCFVRFAAYVFTHNKGIIPVQAGQWRRGAASLSIDADEKIDGGTSGGPVVTSAGRLLGIISKSASASRVHLAAPLWLVRQMVPRATRRRVDAALPPGRLRHIRRAVLLAQREAASRLKLK
jgi:S1-C subfamily serine protease